jgi:hypothetical protein
MQNSSSNSEVTGPSTERIVSLAITNNLQRNQQAGFRYLEPAADGGQGITTVVLEGGRYQDYLDWVESDTGYSAQERKEIEVARAREKYPHPKEIDGVEVEVVAANPGEPNTVLSIDATKLAQEEILQIAVSALNGPDPPRYVYVADFDLSSFSDPGEGPHKAAATDPGGARRLAWQCNTRFDSVNYDYISISPTNRTRIEHSVYWNYGPGGPTHDRRCNSVDECDWQTYHDVGKCGEWILRCSTHFNAGLLGQVVAIADQLNGPGFFHAGYVLYDPNGTYDYIQKIVCWSNGMQADPSMPCPN